jgi:hypothetical protein
MADKWTKHGSLTIKHNSVVDEIASSVWIKSSLEKDFTARRYKVIWDTGATNTVIGGHIAEELGLKAVGGATAYSVNGEYDCECYMVDIRLHNHAQMSNIMVFSGDFNGYDVLVGMDLITCGDFAITNFNGKTTFTFRTPSMTEIDFT